MDTCNIDLATNVSARLQLNKFKDIEFMTQDLNMPGMSVVFPTIQGPRHKTQMPPQAIIYEPLVLTYLLYEDLSNYQTIVDWMQESITSKQEDVYTDGTLFILGAQRTIKRKVAFYGLFPAGISNVNYTTREDRPKYQTATVTFEYLYYKFT